MKPKDYEVIYKFTVAPTVPSPSALNWNAEPIGKLIRCKDCKYNPRNSRRFADDYMTAWYYHCLYMEPTDFCSKAKEED